jgi:hypothetical protein
MIETSDLPKILTLETLTDVLAGRWSVGLVGLLWQTGLVQQRHSANLEF